MFGNQVQPTDSHSPSDTQISNTILSSLRQGGAVARRRHLRRLLLPTLTIDAAGSWGRTGRANPAGMRLSWDLTGFAEPVILTTRMTTRQVLLFVS